MNYFRHSIENRSNTNYTLMLIHLITPKYGAADNVHWGDMLAQFLYEKKLKFFHDESGSGGNNRIKMWPFFSERLSFVW